MQLNGHKMQHKDKNLREIMRLEKSFGHQIARAQNTSSIRSHYFVPIELCQTSPDLGKNFDSAIRQFHVLGQCNSKVIGFTVLKSRLLGQQRGLINHRQDRFIYVLLDSYHVPIQFRLGIHYFQ